MPQTVLLEYNVLFRNAPATVRADLETLQRRYRGISAMVLNEVRAGTPIAKAVDAHLQAIGWESRRSRGEVIMAWNPSFWEADKFGGSRRIAKGSRQHRMNPARHLVFQGLTCRRDGTRHLLYGSHYPAGYARPDGHFPPSLQAYKRKAGKEAVLNTLRIQANHFARHPEYAFHHFLGDLNSQVRHKGQWWYPAQALKGLWVPDTLPRSIDWALHSRSAQANGLKVVRRWSDRRQMDSDHPAHLKKVRW